MHTFKNFKNFADAEIDLSKPMTLLIGRNGSGKSNVIEGVELLAELIKGRDVHEISDIGRGGEFEVRGSLNGCFRQKCESFEVGFKDKFEKANIYYQIPIYLKPVMKIGTSIENFEVITPFIVNEDDINFKAIEEDISIINARIHIVNPIIYEIRKTFLRKYSSVSVFDIYPRVMRQYSPVGLKQLSGNGENISSVLYYLKQNKSDVLDKILERIKELPEEEFVDFHFIETSDNSDVLFALKYPNGEIISAKLLSDGTLRALAILTALETVPEGSRIIIEEIDNGVHASRTHVLIDAIWEASNRRHLNTLITTHNPATLDSLNHEQLECVVVCHYDKQSQSAKLTPFFELPRVGVLLQKGKLGGLVTRNVIERYLDPDSAQERKKLALESLEACR